MDWFEYGPFTVFDLETTGMSPVNDRSVEIAAMRVEVTGKNITPTHCYAYQKKLFSGIFGYSFGVCYICKSYGAIKIAHKNTYRILIKIYIR